MSASEKGVIIQLGDGATYGVASAAIAARVYPDAAIISYQDGSPYTPPKPKAPRRRTRKPKGPTGPQQSAMGPEGGTDGNTG